MSSTFSFGPRGGQSPHILQVENIEVVYNRIALVLRGVSLTVANGGITALLGANGAGKTTTLRAISSLLKGEGGQITRGAIRFGDEPVQSVSPSDMVRKGCFQVMEGRRCFQNLTVEENLYSGAFTRRGRSVIKQELERVYTYFPRLKERRNIAAGYMSGGEQQMCAIGRAMMSGPKLVLLDEPSMGLAPQTTEEIFCILKELNAREGVSFLVAEQNTNVALRFAQEGYILEQGKIVMHGTAEELRSNDDVKEFYLGTAGSERKSFRDVKSYRRAKRWLL